MRLDLRDYDLGLTLEAIALSPPSHRWALGFELLRENILALMAGAPIELHHIGSTAIPGICAKPILDVLGVVQSLAEFEDRSQALQEIGFESKGEYGIKGRRYAVLYDAKKKMSFAHLHVFETSHPAIDSHLRFRDFLSNDLGRAKEYDRIKRDLQLRFKGQRVLYTAMKADFIEKVISEAQLLHFNSGRAPDSMPF